MLPQALSLNAGKLEIPQEALYKKNVLITRGRFRPFTLLHNDMLVGAASQFFCDPDGSLRSQDPDFDTYTDCVYRDDTLVLLELTTRDMMEVSFVYAAGSCPHCAVLCLLQSLDDLAYSWSRQCAKASW